MNRSSRPSWIILWIAFSISIGAPLLSQAATIDWKSDAGTTAWATGSNWIGGVAPANDLTTDIASFNQISYAFQPGATNNRKVAGLIFGNSTVAVTITTASNQARLSLGGSGVLMEETSGAVSLGAASNQGVNLGANQTWTNNSASLLTAYRVDNLTNTTPYTLTIGGSGSGGVEIRVIGNNNNTPSSPGSVGLTINSTGSGVTTLTALNTFTGDTTLTSGTLRLVHASSLSNSALDTTGSGTLQLSGNASLTLGGLKGSRDLSSVITSNYTTVTALGLAVFSGTSSYSGVISNGAATTGLTKAGNGTQILEGANSYSGITTINAGVLAVASLGNGSAASTLGASSNAGSQLVLNGGTLRLTGSTTAAQSTDRLFTVANNGATLDSSAGVGSSMNFTNTGVIIFGSTQGNRTLTLMGSQNGSISSVIGNRNLTANLTALVKSGEGTWILSANNTYTGGTSINAGALQIDRANALSTSGNITFGGGVLRYGSGIATDLSTRIKNSASAVAIDSNGETITYSAAIDSSNSGGLTKLGAGTLVLSANSTYTGGTSINSGTLQMSAASALGTTGNITFGGGTLQYGSGIATDLSSRIKNSSAAIAIDTNGQTVTYASDLDSTNSGGLSKSGSGKLLLSATNTYTGATSITGGTLEVDGSIASSNMTTIGSGGTLSGTGTIGALTIASGGTLNPGNSPGTLTVGNTWFEGGGNYNWQIHDATSTAGTGWDFLSSTGTLTIGATSGDKFKINLWSLSSLSPDTDGPPVNFSASSNYSWNLASFSSIAGFAADKFQIITSATNGTGGFSGFTGLFSISSNGTVLTLNYTAPSATAIWSAGSGNWTAGANWQSGSVPSNGSPLEFSGAGGTSTNDGALSSIGGIEFTSAAGGSYTINGSALQIATAGILNNSTHSQTVDVDLTLTIAQSFNAASANLTISGAVDNDGRLLTAAGNHSVFLQDVISGSGGLAREDNGLLLLTASNSYSGATTINAGTLQIGDGGTSGSLSASSAITNNGLLAFNRSDTVTQGADFSSSGISGSGTLVKNGAGMLVLNAANSYTGGTTITAGTIQLAAANALGTSGNISFGGGTLQYGAGISTDLSPRLIGSTSAIRIDTNGQSVTYASAIDSTNSGGLVKSGAGTLTLSGSNTFTGGVTLHAGTLTLGNNAALGTGTFTIEGGTIDVTAARTTPNNNAQLWNGDFTFVGSKTLSLGAGAVTLNASRQVTVNASTLTIGGAIGDGGNGYGLTKEGAGTLTLSNNTNTYSGATTINAGTLTMGSNNALPEASAVVVNVGGTLNAANRAGRIASLTIDGGSMILSAASITSSGAGVFVDDGAMAFSGVQTGRVRIDGLATMGNFTFSYNDSANQSDDRGLVIGGGVLVQNGADVAFTNNSSGLGRIELNGNTTITVGAGSSMDVAWIVDDFAGSSTLTKDGAGTLVLAAENTYTGNTVINTGTVSIGSTGAFGSTGAVTLGASANLVYTGSVGNLSRAITISSGTATLENNGSGLLTISGSITKNGTTLVLDGGSHGIDVTGVIGGSAANSDLVVDGNVTLSAANTYNGPTTINTGAKLTAAVANAMGSTTDVVVHNGGSLLVGANDAINDSASIELAGGTLEFGGNINETVGALTLSANSTIDMGGGNIALEFTGLVAALTNTTRLNIYNYTLYSDHLYFSNDTNLASSLQYISFYSDFGTTFIGNSFISSFSSPYQVQPVPEPEAWLAAALILGGMGIAYLRRKHSGATTN